MSTEQQTSKLVASLVEHQSEFRELPNDDAQWVIQNTKAAVALFIKAIKDRQPILTLLGAIKVRLEENFTARDFFQVNTKKTAPVKISYVRPNFTSWFLSKKETRPTASETVPGDGGPYRTPDQAVPTLRYHTLNRGSVDKPIIAELGGETTLAEIADCMKKQANGENGALLTNSYANIFYVRDSSLALRAVRVGWYGGGWNVGADSVGHPVEWDAGCRVFSR